jgi:hypothetical protein
MTTNVPLLLRFATPFGRVRESGEPEGLNVSSVDRNPAVTDFSSNSRGESRFTRVRDETTDDE